MATALRCALGTALLISVGCAGDGPVSDHTRGPQSGGTTPGGASSGTTTTPSGQAPVVGGTDNPMFDPSTIVSAPMAPDAGCMVGERCYGKEPDDPGCGTLKLEAEVEVIEHPGNVLLVFDTSGSMAMEWNGSPRWESAGNAVKNALTPLQDMLTIGTVFFPRSDPNAPMQCIDPTGITCLIIPLYVQGGTCGVTPVTAADQINFAAGAQFLTTFTGPGGNTAPPYAPVPGGFTPLKEGLMQAQAALASATLTGTTSVVIVTDGDPNCEWDQAVSQQIVTDWAAAGIKTYVIGLPGTGNQGDAILTDLAMRGGTGQYITPADPATLEMKLREIATETVMSGFDSCTIGLNPPAEAPEKLLMIVEENGMRLNVPHDAGSGAGWTVSPDGTTVEIIGGLCNDAMSGRFNAINFEFGCPDVPPPPTLPPVI